MYDYSYNFEEIFYLIEQFMDALGSVEGILASIVTIVTFITTGVSVVVGIITAIVSAIVFLVTYVVMAIPLFSLAKKTGSKFAWLAWCPVFCSEARLFVLCDIAGKKPFDLWGGKIKFENRIMAPLLFLVIKFFGNTLVLAFIAIASTFLPVVGSLSSILILVPSIACNIIYYVFTRDILDVFCEDKKSNVTTAVVICVVDAILLCGLARTFYFYTLLKRKPLIENEVVVEQSA